MKKIFIKDSIVYLSSIREVGKFMQELRRLQQSARVCYFTTTVKLEEQIAEIENTATPEVILFLHESAADLEKSFFSMYKPIYAAGGAVINKKERLLMIFRRGKWDLPKGKVDKGETIKAAALREIREETGIDKLKIVSPIRFLGGKQDCTYHTYLLKGQRVIKSTYWFKMTSSDTKQLIPQEEEDIERVEWCSKKLIIEHLQNSFHSIEEVIRESLL